MRKKKTFDCVQMKWEIQRKLAEEQPGMPEEEKRRMQMQRVANNPILGPFLRRAQRVSTEPSGQEALKSADHNP